MKLLKIISALCLCAVLASCNNVSDNVSSESISEVERVLRKAAPRKFPTKAQIYLIKSPALVRYTRKPLLLTKRTKRLLKAKTVRSTLP